MNKMNFDKRFTTYDDNAIVQRKAACHLLDFVEKNSFDSKKFKNIIEIGCGTGILTEEIVKRYSPEKIVLNDIFDTRKYIKESYENFILGDIMKIELPQAQTIVSSSVFQWITPFEHLIKKLAPYENLVFSIYTEGNLKEITEHFGISLEYYSHEELTQILKKFFPEVIFAKEQITLEFSSPFEALRHLQATGVTGFGKTSPVKIRNFLQQKLTYELGYFLCKKSMDHYKKK